MADDEDQDLVEFQPNPTTRRTDADGENQARLRESRVPETGNEGT